MNNSESWERVWSDRSSRTPGAGLARAGDLQRIVLDRLRATGKLEDDPRVLEVGCGTAPVLEMLKGVSAGRFGVDVSPTSALLSSRVCLASVADGRRLPFSGNSFDLVFSTGVLDLFDDDQVPLFLAEMSRVTRKNGKMVVITAHERCRLHEGIKSRLMEGGRWKYGPKRAFSTLSKHMPPDLRISDEKRMGALFQLRFVSYLFEDHVLLRRSWNLFFLILSAVLYPLNRLPGALLVTEMEKL